MDDKISRYPFAFYPQAVSNLVGSDTIKFMNVPAIYQSLQEFTLFQGMSLIGGLVALSFALLWVERTRFVLPLWIALNTLLSIFASQLLPPYIALAILVTAVFSTTMVYLTARSRAQTVTNSTINWPIFLFQFLLAIFFLLMVWGAVYQAGFTIIADNADTTFIVFSLGLMGIYRFVTTTRPLPLGMGILLIVTAVGVWQISTLQRPLAVGVWAALVMMTTLVISYLMQTEQGDSSEQNRTTQSIQNSVQL